MPTPPATTERPPHARVLNPDRPRALACLVTLSSAPEGVCREALSESPADPISVVVARHHAQRALTLQGHVDLREAWEMVAPDGWLGDARRAFTTASRAALADVPASRHDMMALASDPAGVLTAESLAEEALRRMSAAGVKTGVTASTPRMIWWCESPERFRPRFTPTGGLGRRVQGTANAAEQKRAEKAADELRRALAPRVGGSAWDAAETLRWSLLCQPMGERNPFAPLWALWESGYAFDGFAPEGCVLVAPKFA